MATEIIALKRAGIPFKHDFMCEKDPTVQFLLIHNYPKTRLFQDVCDEDHVKAPSVDLYVAGFPCQPFSTAGLNKGLSDERGGALSGILSYLTRAQPKCFVLENVAGLVGCRHRKARARVGKLACGFILHGEGRKAERAVQCLKLGKCCPTRYGRFWTTS
jgi:DNA (cytosine-5)-methyltransferase 1